MTLVVSRNELEPEFSHRQMSNRIQELLQANELATRRIGRVDHVTRLPNRVEFLDDFNASKGASEDKSTILITLADAKHFNELLRALGHAYSEDFVRAGAERALSLMEPGAKLYHVSVLSFAFFADSGSDGQPPKIVQDIVKAFRAPIICQDIPVDAKTGVGVTPLSGNKSSAGEILRATLAAAQDSRKTYDGWAWYNKKTDEAHMRAFRILTDLPMAIATTGQLSLNFQPRIALRERRCISAEALIRWTHPEMGIVSPAEFVALAETTALITPLTQWVIDNALMTLADWQKMRRDLKLSINISPKNIEEPGFVEDLQANVGRMGVDPARIELEFTEGTLASNPVVVMEQLGRLRAAGFEIAIDDFGSGYSNMSYLGKIPAKYLKIDQSFIRPLEYEQKTQVLVRSIIELAHSLNYQVVAEGIETEAAYDMLSSWCCDEGQGYFMSRPLHEAQFLQWHDLRHAQDIHHA